MVVSRAELLLAFGALGELGGGERDVVPPLVSHVLVPLDHARGSGDPEATGRHIIREAQGYLSWLARLTEHQDAVCLPQHLVNLVDLLDQMVQTSDSFGGDGFRHDFRSLYVCHGFVRGLPNDTARCGDGGAG